MKEVSGISVDNQINSIDSKKEKRNLMIESINQLKGFVVSEKNIVAKACGTDYQSIYMIGAIYAFAINNVLKETEATNLQKLRLIIKWSKTLKVLFEISKDTESLLHAATTSFYRIFQEEFPDKKSLCMMYFVSFPESGYSCE